MCICSKRKFEYNIKKYSHIYSSLTFVCRSVNFSHIIFSNRNLIGFFKAYKTFSILKWKFCLKRILRTQIQSDINFKRLMYHELITLMRFSLSAVANLSPSAHHVCFHFHRHTHTTFATKIKISAVYAHDRPSHLRADMAQVFERGRR